MAHYPYRKLYRARIDRMIGGVCSGLAQYFHVDPTIIRLIAVLLTLFGGASVLIYIILWIIIPLEPIRRRPQTIDMN